MLATALAKEPEERFESTETFLRAWSAIRRRAVASEVTNVEQRGRLAGVRARVLERLRVGGRLWEEGLGRAPVCSVSGGGVGGDLWVGRTGVLLACANLLGAVEAIEADGTGIRELGDRLSNEIALRIAAYGPVRDCPELPNYGIAHGWAGHLYAAMRWSAVTRRRPGGWIGARLDELAECGEPHGRGLRWPWRDELPHPGTRARYGAGWCSGSAGFAFLWTLASDVFDREDYFELARRAAWYAWEDGVSAAHLCCGYAGRAYALLHFYSRTGEEAWRERATILTVRAVERLGALRNGTDKRFADAGLYRGDVGIALLISELATPEVATMPFFGDEGWRVPASR